jgi:hypothetical protein
MTDFCLSGCSGRLGRAGKAYFIYFWPPEIRAIAIAHSKDLYEVLNKIHEAPDGKATVKNW